MKSGDVFDVEKLRKGLENLKKLYGEFGYIDFVGEPSFEFRDAEDPALIDLNLTVDEGRQFFVRRINFAGNDTTRDKVIRRELLLDEGDMFKHQAVGPVDSAPQPARLLRAAQGRRVDRHPPRYAQRPGRSDAGGQGGAARTR